MSIIFGTLAIIIRLYTFVIFARILITWVPNLDPYHPAVVMLRQVTDPVLEPARNLIPAIGMIDISPIVVLIILSFLERILLQLAGGM